MNEIIVRFKAMPMTIKAFTLTDENNDYNIYINEYLDDTEKNKAYCHEIDHISRNHFYRDSLAVEDETELKQANLPQESDICRTLKELRTKAGLTMAQTAAFAHIRTSMYAEMEKGLRKFPSSTEQDVIDILLKHT